MQTNRSAGQRHEHLDSDQNNRLTVTATGRVVTKTSDRDPERQQQLSPFAGSWRDVTLLRLSFLPYDCHPRKMAITLNVSMNPWARMQTHRLRPDKTKAAPSTRPAMPESTIPEGPL